MNKKEGGKSQWRRREKDTSTFANILYVNCRDKRLSLQARKDLSPPQRKHQEKEISSPRPGQRRSTAPSAEEPITVMMAWPARSLTLMSRARRRQKRWNLTQRPFYRNPFSWGHGARPLAFGFLFCAASCPDRVLAWDLPADYCARYSAQLFQPAEISASQAPKAECSATTTCISCTKGSLSASSRKLASFCSMVEQTPLSSEHYRNQVKPTARPPPYHGMKRQTVYI